MGIRESLLNTITSVADSDFVRIVTSAGASSKATVRNLFKGFESNLGAKSSLTTSDYIRVVGSDNNAYKESVADVKSAMGVTTLENRFKLYTGDIDTLLAAGIYGISGATGTLPPSGTHGTLAVLRGTSDNYVTQVARPNGSLSMYVRYRNSGTWSAWQKITTTSI